METDLIFFCDHSVHDDLVLQLLWELCPAIGECESRRAGGKKPGERLYPPGCRTGSDTHALDQVCLLYQKL